MQQSRWLQDDGGTQNARRTHQQCTQAGDNPIGSPKVGSALPTAIQNQDLVSHQDGFGNKGTEPTGPSKPDDDDNHMQKKSENVAHARDGIKLKNLKNSRPLRNSPPTPSRSWVSRIIAGRLATVEPSSS